MAIKITYRLTSRLSMRIVRNGDVHVSAPVGLPRTVVEAFIREHADWIVTARQRTLQRVKQRNDFYAQLPLATTAQRRAAVDRLSAIVEPLVERYSREMNVQPSAITYRALKSRWGQCNIRTRQVCFSTYDGRRSEEIIGTANQQFGFLFKSHGLQYLVDIVSTQFRLCIHCCCC